MQDIEEIYNNYAQIAVSYTHLPSAPKKSSLKTTLFLDEIKGESINGRKK